MAYQDQYLGSIRAAVKRVRQLVDEPSIEAKYSDRDIVDLLNESWSEVVGDVFACAQHPPYAQHDIQLSTSQYVYPLPASVGEIRRIAKFSDNDEVEWEILPEGLLNPSGYGIILDGNHLLRMRPEHGLSDVITIEYIPSGDITCHVGQVILSGATTTVFPVSPTAADVLLGDLDGRPNAYAGCIFRWLSHGGTTSLKPAGYNVFPVQVRRIASYSVAAPSVTVVPAFDFDPTSLPNQELRSTYEIYPVEAPVIWPVIARHTARLISGMENKTGRFKTLTQLYEEAKRACVLRWGSLETRLGQSMETVTPENLDHYGIL